MQIRDRIRGLRRVRAGDLCLHPKNWRKHPEKAKPTGKKLRAKDRPLVNDFMTDEAFDQLRWPADRRSSAAWVPNTLPM